MFCIFPHYGMTIHPDGHVAMCCSNKRDWHFGHISEIDDLQETWDTHPEAIKLREDDEATIDAACGYCYKNRVNWNTRWNHVHETPYQDNVRKYDGVIRYLEYTTSNICNQTCATCSSYFSSKWAPLEKELAEFGFDFENAKSKKHPGFASYDHEISRLEKPDIDKIIKLVPQLDTLYIKGGEPFADQNNFTVIEELLKVNPQAKIHFTSNFSKVPQDFIDLFKKYNGKPRISVSMDGVYDVYQYVRSSPFQQTIDNIKHWYNETGINVNIGTYTSLYNMWNLKEYLDYFQNNLLKEVYRVHFQQWIASPKYIAPEKVLFPVELDEYEYTYLNKLKPYFEDSRFVDVNLTNFVKKTNTTGSTRRAREEFKQYTDFLNFKRGINIYELCPQLKGIK